MCVFFNPIHSRNVLVSCGNWHSTFFLPGHQMGNGIFLPLPFQLLKFLVFFLLTVLSYCLHFVHLQTNPESFSWPSIRKISRTALNEVSNRGALLRKIFNRASKLSSMQCIFISWRFFYWSYKLYKWKFQIFIYIRLIKSRRWSTDTL